MNIYGNHDDRTIAQLERCVAAEDGAIGVLCADGHLGYSMPIGGVVGYRNFVSPSGVGYDIACGNMAVRTNIQMESVTAQQPDELSNLADEIQNRISFGIGRKNNEPVDSPVFERIEKSSSQKHLVQLAANQLGTVGSGNHYVDVFEDELGRVWVGVHFGSRGFGHKTATGFMNIAAGRKFDDKPSAEDMDAPPTLLDIRTPSGQDYIEAMKVAGEYAYAGREAVVAKVLEILGAQAVETIHNHHNFTWQETHNGESFWVVRKGATPACPGQLGFVGGSMGDISVILKGVESEASAAALYSTVHGAGRVMSRMRAKKGTHEWTCLVAGCLQRFVPPQVKPPKNMKCPVHDTQLVKLQLEPGINFRDVQDSIKARGTILRGAGADEAPAAYRPLASVLDAHKGTIAIEQVLTPRIVVMAGGNEHDPYKD